MKTSQDVDVRLINSMGSDRSIIASARVSTQGEASLESLLISEASGLINFLMRNRHGTPFEHGALTFFVKAPIFVFREFHRHRIGFSYNEESGRYKELEGEFYIPSPERPGLMQREGGKPGYYEYVDATEVEYNWLNDEFMDAYQYAYNSYKVMLKLGYAKEVARMVLPVGIFSSMYVTCNPRSLMSFLSLRTKREAWSYHEEDMEDEDINIGRAKFPSKPQHEINMVADRMEAEFAKLFPITHECYNKNGRVAP